MERCTLAPGVANPQTSAPAAAPFPPNGSFPRSTMPDENTHGSGPKNPAASGTARVPLSKSHFCMLRGAPGDVNSSEFGHECWVASTDSPPVSMGTE